jgi:hypothetical protein
MVPESWVASVVLRITKYGKYGDNDNGIVGEWRAINGEKMNKYVSS